MGGFSLGEIGLVGQIEGAAGSQHGVDEHEGAAVEIGRSDVFDANLDVFLATFLAVGADKGAVCTGEDVEETFVEG